MCVLAFIFVLLRNCCCPSDTGNACTCNVQAVLHCCSCENEASKAKHDVNQETEDYRVPYEYGIGSDDWEDMERERPYVAQGLRGRWRAKNMMDRWMWWIILLIVAVTVPLLVWVHDTAGEEMIGWQGCV